MNSLHVVFTLFVAVITSKVGALSILPPEPTTLGPPDGCRLDNGTVVEGLKPGDSYTPHPCSSCYCDQRGRIMCAMMSCAMPMCGPLGHYTVKGECCPRCRQECKAKDGTIVKAGERFNNGPCSSCTCSRDGHAMCMMMACALPFCGEFPTYTVKGQCCPRCRTGCMLANGTEIKGMKPGDEVKTSPCSTCVCNKDWTAECYHLSCARPFCGDKGYFTPFDQCCPVCRTDCDDDDDNCRFLAYTGQCEADETVPDKCKKSCGKCMAECKDESTNCEGWAKDGWCERNLKWMTRNCPRSCNACRPRNDCYDRDLNNCRWWAKKGECRENSAWMTQNCRQSCGVCKGDCADWNGSCEGWAKDGWCSKAETWMTRNCARSCNACAPQ